jgi:hypothetical protein
LSTKNSAFAISTYLLLSVKAFAAQSADLSGHVIRARDSQPVANAAVQIAETGAKTTTNASGAYTFEGLQPGVYTVMVTPKSATPVQHKVKVVAGSSNHDDFSIESEISALEQIVVLAQRTTNAVAREAQFEAPNLVNITTYAEIRKIPDISVAEAVRRIPGISLETD